MRTLVESLFDNDVASKSTNISLDIIKDMVEKALSKYHLKEYDYNRDIQRGKKPHEPFIMPDNGADRDYFSIVIGVPNGVVYNETGGKEEAVIAISFVIAKDDEDDENYSLYRVDVFYIKIYSRDCNTYSSNFWDGNAWTRYTRLKTNEITSKSINDIIKYITKTIDYLFGLAEDDQQEIADIFFGTAREGGDPLMYGKKDPYWYLEKMKKELE